MRFTTISFAAVFGAVAVTAYSDARTSLIRREVPGEQSMAHHEDHHKIERQAQWAERIERHEASGNQSRGEVRKTNRVDVHFGNTRTHTQHFDAHNHIGGTLGWRAYALAYLMAQEPSADARVESFQKTVAAIDDNTDDWEKECTIDPADYGRTTTSWPQRMVDKSEFCMHVWIRTVFLRNNGCATFSGGNIASIKPECKASNTRMKALLNISRLTGKLIAEEFGKYEVASTKPGNETRLMLGGEDLDTKKKQIWGSHTLFPLLRCIRNFPNATGKTWDTLTDADAFDLDRLIDSSISASPQLDFDTSYGSRAALAEWLEAKLTNGADSDGTSLAEGTTASERALLTKRTLTPPAVPSNDKHCTGPPYSCPKGWFTLACWNYHIHELVMLGIRHVQWSQPPGKLPTEDCEGVWAGAGKKAINKCKSQYPLYWLMYGDNKAKPPQPPAPIIAKSNLKFGLIPLMLGDQFAQTPDGKSEVIQSNQEGQMRTQKYRLSAGPGGQDDVLDRMGSISTGAKLWKQKDVNGIDFASPEFHAFKLVNGTAWTTGGEWLKSSLDLIFAKAKDENQRFFFHVHVGEGYPAWDYKKNGFKKDSWTKDDPTTDVNLEWAEPAKDYDEKAGKIPEICADARRPYSDQTSLEVSRKPDGTPTHYKNGNNNMVALLDGIEKYRKELEVAGTLASFDDHVLICFGHSTHADKTVADRMVANQVWTDIDLTSNLATAAISTMNAINESDWKKDQAYEPVRYLESLGTTLAGTANGKKLIKTLFAPHGLKPMYDNGVCMVLSTDGSGVEHSHFDQEYAFAETILGESSAPKFDRMVDMLTKWIEAPPGSTPGLKRDCSKLD